MLLLLALLGVAVFNTLVYIGLHTTTAVNGVLMQSTMPIWIVLLSYFPNARGELAGTAIT